MESNSNNRAIVIPPPDGGYYHDIRLSNYTINYNYYNDYYNILKSVAKILSEETVLNDDERKSLEKWLEGEISKNWEINNWKDIVSCDRPKLKEIKEFTFNCFT